MSLFGAHRTAPDARPGAKALPWFLTGNAELVALTAAAAALRTGTGASHRLLRERPVRAEAVAIWQLGTGLRAGGRRAIAKGDVVRPGVAG